MPHAGLMDEHTLKPEQALLQRARLHIRGGKRRLRQGKIEAGIVTLSDALSAAAERYFRSPERKASLSVKDTDNLNDDATLFAILRRSGVLDDRFDYEEFDRLVERALYKEDLSDFDYQPIVRGIESVMERLGVMPFDESALPPEDPATF